MNTQTYIIGKVACGDQKMLLEFCLTILLHAYTISCSTHSQIPLPLLQNTSRPFLLLCHFSPPCFVIYQVQLMLRSKILIDLDDLLLGRQPQPQRVHEGSGQHVQKPALWNTPSPCSLALTSFLLLLPQCSPSLGNTGVLFRGEHSAVIHSQQLDQV